MTSVLAPTAEEIAGMSPKEIAERKEAMARNVFGDGYRPNGKSAEVGIGSPGNVNANHLMALEKDKSNRNFNEAILKSVSKD